MARVSFVAAAVVTVLLAQTASALNCLLLHGIGQDGPGTPLAPGAVKTTDKNYLRPGVNMPDYWGDVGGRLQRAGCSSVFGYWTNSVDFAWSDEAIQREYCAAIVATNADVIFTHSMGGPIIAAAIHEGRPGCADRIGPGPNAKTHWYGLQSPLGGSESADVLKDLCKNEVIARFAGKNCQHNGDGSWSISRAYASLMTANSPKWLTESARTHESGNMCGVLTQNLEAVPDRIGALGLKNEGLALVRGGMGVALELIRDTINVAFKLKGLTVPPDWVAHNLPTKSGSPVPLYGTDGMVAFSSCRTQDVSMYRKDPKNLFYAVEANHGDGRGTFGDDAHTLNFQPITYMINMVAHTAATKKPNGPVTLMPRFSRLFDADEAQEWAEFDAEDEEEEQDEAEEEEEVEADEEDEAEDQAEDEAEDEAENEAEEEAEDEAEEEAEF